MFLVILLILFGFFELWRQPLWNATILLRGETTQPTKSFGENLEISQVDPRGVALSPVRFAAVKRLTTNGYQAVASAVGYLAALAKPNLVNNSAVSKESRSLYFRNRELGRGAKRIIKMLEMQ